MDVALYCAAMEESILRQFYNLWCSNSRITREFFKKFNILISSNLNCVLVLQNFISRNNLIPLVLA